MYSVTNLTSTCTLWLLLWLYPVFVSNCVMPFFFSFRSNYSHWNSSVHPGYECFLPDCDTRKSWPIFSRHVMAVAMPVLRHRKDSQGVATDVGAHRFLSLHWINVWGQGPQSERVSVVQGKLQDIEMWYLQTRQLLEWFWKHALMRAKSFLADSGIFFWAASESNVAP